MRARARTPGMAAARPVHQCRVLASPWEGVYATEIRSARHYGLAEAPTLAAAAGACGFSDQSHMTRIFTRQFGFTPGAWQRARAPQ